MKARWATAFSAAGVIGLSLLAPGPATASAAGISAAPSAEKPSGKAMVRIDGGTAYAKEKSTGTYRVIVPDGAEIDWMGEVTGKGVRTGTFTPKALVAGWARMGHRDGTKATTTLTWVEKGKADATFQLAYLSKPRINSDGRLTFLASTPAGARLPRLMMDFSINVTVATETPRSFTVFGPPIYFDQGQTTWVYANATDVSAGWVYFVYQSASNTCHQGMPLGGTVKYMISSSFPCGVYTVNPATTNGSASYVVMAPPPPGSSSGTVGYINGAFSVTPKGGSPFDISQSLMAYTKGGGGSGGSTPS